MLGIDGSWVIGEWIQRVRFLDADGVTDLYVPYAMNAPIEAIVYDFDRQLTFINGLIGE